MNRKNLLITTFALCLINSVCLGQTSDWKESLQGNWKCDAGKTIEIMKRAETPEGQLEMMKEMLPGFNIQFKEDAVTINMDGGGFKDSKTGTFEIADSDAEKKILNLKVQMVGEEKKTGEVTFLDDEFNSIQLVADDGSTIIFNRVEEKEENQDK